VNASPSRQLVLPSLEGQTYPEARLRFAGGMEVDAATIEEYLGAAPKIGDSVEVTVKAVVRSKQFKRGSRTEDGLEVDKHMLTIVLAVDSIEPA
jgi:hypothetical protein